MISVQEALGIVQKTASLSTIKTLSIYEAVGYVLAKDVEAIVNFPPFNQSAMDGYAIADFQSTEYVQKGVIKAGQDATSIEIGKGEVYRIFTGGMVPLNALAVVRQEDAKVDGNTISFEALPKEFANIRFESESVKKGEVVLKKDTPLTPAGIGLLVSLGIEKVEVYTQQAIAIVSTGDELIPLGNPLSSGKIYESNALMLSSALKCLGWDRVETYHVKDSSESTYALLNEVIQKFDYILISGGVSVGDYDFVADALLKIGVNQEFHKVKQKPGKPFFYGTYQNKKIFGLPGNPAAALTLFYVYVLPSLNYAIGTGFKGLRTLKLTSLNDFGKGEPRAQFLKALADEDNQVFTILGGQSSAMLQTFAVANALVYVEEGREVQQGKDYLVYLL
jgi:molybdopterin molybdotransferase